MIDVERTDFVSVPVQDMERAKRFYRDALGRRSSDEFEGETLDTGVCHVAFFRPSP